MTYAGHTGQRLRTAIGYVCGNTPYIRQTLIEAGNARALDAALEAIRSAADPEPALTALHEALLAAGDARGIMPTVRGLRPAGANAHLPALAVYVCPTDRCSRHSRAEHDDPPRCTLSGEPLRLTRL
ncbi:hypothetical protein [Streptomyces macrosporus]|uniref:Uncharacterized protein n=1 Tax=Streptomyces macrosporus TaxID=44032 RepID=A0ABN3JT62_9ACTN